MQDIVDQLESLAAEWATSTREHATMMYAAVEIGRLRKDVAHHKAQYTVAVGSDPRIGASPLSFADRMNDYDKRIAELESRVRLTQHRLAAAAQMCADIDRDPRIHSSIQVAMSLVGKALESEPQEDDGHV